MEALSKSESMIILLDQSAASEVTLLETPLEAEVRTLSASFAKQQHGTLESTVTPELLSQCAGLRTIAVNETLRSLACAIQYLQSQYEKGSSPAAIVNPGVIASAFTDVDSVEDLPQDIIASAEMSIDLINNLPCIEGTPIWEKLPGERLDFYLLFKFYRDMRYFLLDDGTYVVTNRALSKLADKLSLKHAVVNYIAKLESWQTRVMAFDAFMEREIRIRKAQEAEMITNRHLAISTMLCEKAWSKLNSSFEKMQPKELLQALELGLKFGRLSAGLLSDRPGSSFAGGQPSLAIHNSTTINSAEQMLNITPSQNVAAQGTSSAVELQLQKEIKDPGNVLAILNVLQQSGAMSSAVKNNIDEHDEFEEEAEEDIIDMEE